MCLYHTTFFSLNIIVESLYHNCAQVRDPSSAYGRLLQNDRLDTRNMFLKEPGTNKNKKKKQKKDKKKKKKRKNNECLYTWRGNVAFKVDLKVLLE